MQTEYTQIAIDKLKHEEKQSINTLQSDKLNLSILQHGIMVSQYFFDLYSNLQFNSKLQYNWKIPSWLIENKDIILKNLLPLNILTTYQMYHDIGKPYCKTYQLDDKTKYHFDNHANISANIYKSIDNNEIIYQLIKRDMDIHLIKANQLEDFIGKSKLDFNIAISLLITGLTEIHANAEMFGGIESNSYKIKYKQIDSRGKQIIKLIKEKQC